MGENRLEKSVRENIHIQYKREEKGERGIRKGRKGK